MAFKITGHIKIVHWPFNLYFLLQIHKITNKIYQTQNQTKPTKEQQQLTTTTTITVIFLALLLISELVLNINLLMQRLTHLSGHIHLTAHAPSLQPKDCLSPFFVAFASLFLYLLMHRYPRSSLQVCHALMSPYSRLVIKIIEMFNNTIKNLK